MLMILVTLVPLICILHTNKSIIHIQPQWDLFTVYYVQCHSIMNDYINKYI